MARFLVLGAGRQGVACGTYLLERQPDTQVVYGDVSPERLGSVRDQASHPQRVSTNLIDVGRNEQELEALIADCDCVISCVPFFFNEGLTRLAIRRGKHFCDLGGNVDTVRRQLAIADAAREAGVCVVPDCGLAPGTVNVLAELWRDRWQYRSVKILCGGLPQHPKGILGYQANFSIHGLLNEYLDDCQVARGGQVLTIPGLSELERVSGLAVPGEFEAFATSGGASLGPELYAPLGIDYARISPAGSADVSDHLQGHNPSMLRQTTTRHQPGAWPQGIGRAGTSRPSGCCGNRLRCRSRAENASPPPAVRMLCLGVEDSW